LKFLKWLFKGFFSQLKFKTLFGNVYIYFHFQNYWIHKSTIQKEEIKIYFKKMV